MKCSPVLVLVFAAAMFSLTARAQWINGQSAQVILGKAGTTQAGPNSITPAGFNGPYDVAIDRTTGKVFVSDSYNHRVLRFSSTAVAVTSSSAEAVLGQPDFSSNISGTTQILMYQPYGLECDAAGNLYVADQGNNRVLRYDQASSKASGAAADVVLGQPSFTGNSPGSFPANEFGMNKPYGLAVDKNGSLFVADLNNNRILRFDSAASKTNGAAANGVLGQAAFTTRATAVSQTGLSYPQGIAVDTAGSLYVVDNGAGRILRYDNAATKANGAAANGVLGAATFTAGGNLSNPYDVAVDRNGTLWLAGAGVTKYLNARLKANGAAADGSISANIAPGSNVSLSDNHGIAIDAAGNLYVASINNCRVLRYNNIAAKTFPEYADVILGQPNFNFNAQNRIDEKGLGTPRGAIIDPATGKLFVSDGTVGRVLRYANAASITSGSAAEAVLGQPDFVSKNPFSPATASTLSPYGLAIDASGNLFVADYGNNRVLRFANASTRLSGAAADGVLGQPIMTSSTASASATGMSHPGGVAIDTAGNLFVADTWNNRVLRFSAAASKANGAAADGVLGQASFASTTSATTQSGMNSPQSVAVDAAGNLYVAEYGNSRVLRFANAAGLPNGANADVVLGQSGFTSSTQAVTQSGMDRPYGVAVDGAGNLYVADYNNNRTLVFLKAAAKANGAPANNVLGQSSFTVKTSANHLGGQAGPVGIAIDNSNNKIWVVESGNNRTTRYAASKSIATDVGQADDQFPNECGLSQNFPNPFNPATAIQYAVAAPSPEPRAPSEVEGSRGRGVDGSKAGAEGPIRVRLSVFDLLGREVAVLVNETKSPGTYTATWNASNYSSGVYLCRLTVGLFTTTKKMLVAK